MISRFPAILLYSTSLGFRGVWFINIVSSLKSFYPKIMSNLWAFLAYNCPPPLVRQAKGIRCYLIIRSASIVWGIGLPPRTSTPSMSVIKTGLKCRFLALYKLTNLFTFALRLLAIIAIFWFIIIIHESLSGSTRWEEKIAAQDICSSVHIYQHCHFSSNLQVSSQGKPIYWRVWANDKEVSQGIPDKWKPLWRIQFLLKLQWSGTLQ